MASTSPVPDAAATWLVGSFTILAIARGAGDVLQSLGADFVQHRLSKDRPVSD